MNIKEWWDDAHVGRSIYVSNYGGHKLWASLNIMSLLGKGGIVLEIGVGDGKNARELFKYGHTVHTLDISPLALDKVKNYSVKQWLETEIENIPKNTFDIVISHLVSQHLNNDTLLRQLKCLLPTLKPDGVFAMQFACWLVEGVYEESLAHQKSGSVCRTLDQVQELVSTAGGKISWVSPDRPEFKKYGSCWYFIHIQRRL